MSDKELEDLKEVVRTCPAIDNHAHNLLLPSHQQAYSLLGACSEATGDALQDSKRSLPHMRMVRQLRKLYGCPSDATWDELMAKREQLISRDSAGFLKKCFQGIHTILMDDGLDSTTVHAYDWHDEFTPGKTFRIVRIETVAADILRAMYRNGSLHINLLIDDEEACADVWVTFLRAFESAIADEIKNPEVAGFKSVICYRTGLDVQVAADVDVAANGLDAFREEYLPLCTHNDFRVAAKGLNDCILISTCRLLTAGLRETGMAKPLQFHTGLGDNDISLLRSDPSYLQPLITSFPDVRIILLHSSYPYTRQAGYLATVFSNTYLDLGEVFPQVSRDGQESIIRQAMEVTPMSKLLYSTDAHHFGEVYWLANTQFREVFEKVLVDYVQHQDLTIEEAIRAAEDIFFNNSRDIYNLDVTMPPLKKKPLQLAWTSSRAEETEKPAHYDGRLFELYQKHHSDLKYVYVQWLDYMATIRSRILPVKQFEQLISNNRRIAIALGNTGTLQNDTITPAVNVQGQIYVTPDLTTLRPTHTKDPLASATVFASFTAEDGAPLASCPRSNLKRFVNTFEKEYEISFLVGFEIEVAFLKIESSDSARLSRPLTTNHAWGTLTPEEFVIALPLLAEIEQELGQMGIELLQFHSESGPGQYEVVLPPLPPMEAVDTLLAARQAVHQIAHSHQLRATLHPQPLQHVGSGQHMHLSLNSSTLSSDDLSKKEGAFFASILEHLPGICAFTLPNEVSYERVRDNVWAGGTWCSWGSNNREVPLRMVNDKRWEVRCLDGFANPYLALGAILAAGLMGVTDNKTLDMKDCKVSPASLSDDQRREYGITKRLPSNLEEALAALEGDGAFGEMMSSELVQDFIAMKRVEREMLDAMPEEERRIWLLERY